MPIIEGSDFSSWTCTVYIEVVIANRGILFGKNCYLHKTKSNGGAIAILHLICD